MGKTWAKGLGGVGKHSGHEKAKENEVFGAHFKG